MLYYRETLVHPNGKTRKLSTSWNINLFFIRAFFNKGTYLIFRKWNITSFRKAQDWGVDAFLELYDIVYSTRMMDEVEDKLFRVTSRKGSSATAQSTKS